MKNLQIKKTNSELYNACLLAISVARLADPLEAKWADLLEEVEVTGPLDFDLRGLAGDQRFFLIEALTAYHNVLAQRGRPHDYPVIGALSVALARVRAAGAAA